MRLRATTAVSAAALVIAAPDAVTPATMAGADAAGRTPSVSTAVASPTPLRRAHAHNDYLNDPRLTGALGHGFTSVEADVWLRDPGDSTTSALMLCHDYKPDGHCYDDENTVVQDPAQFAPTYLAGLKSWIDAHGARVYPDHSAPIHLLVEIKYASATIGGADTCTTTTAAAPPPVRRARTTNVLTVPGSRPRSSRTTRCCTPPLTRAGRSR